MHDSAPAKYERVPDPFLAASPSLPSAGMRTCFTPRPLLTDFFVQAVLLHQRCQVGLAPGLQPHQGGAHIIRHNLVL